MGQVTYALLTRPPLSFQSLIRRFSHEIPARLACVRHAASVHPEPGSNSQFNGILSEAFAPAKIKFELFALLNAFAFCRYLLPKYRNYCFFGIVYENIPQILTEFC